MQTATNHQIIFISTSSAVLLVTTKCKFFNRKMKLQPILVITSESTAMDIRIIISLISSHSKNHDCSIRCHQLLIDLYFTSNDVFTLNTFQAKQPCACFIVLHLASIIYVRGSIGIIARRT